MTDEQREVYNSRIRKWRKNRWENMNEEQRLALKRYQNSLNRKSRMRLRLAMMRINFAKIENLKVEHDE